MGKKAGNKVIRMKEGVSLINGYCDLVNKLLYFIQNYFEGIIPAGRLDEDLYWKTKDFYDRERQLLCNGRKEEQLIDLLTEYLRLADEYFERGKLWENSKNDRRACRNTVLNSVQLVANLTVLLSKVAPHPADLVSEWLGLGDAWEIKKVHSGYELPHIRFVAYEDVQIGA